MKHLPPQTLQKIKEHELFIQESRYKFIINSQTSTPKIMEDLANDVMERYNRYQEMMSLRRQLQYQSKSQSPVCHGRCSSYDMSIKIVENREKKQYEYADRNLEEVLYMFQKIEEQMQ